MDSKIFALTVGIGRYAELPALTCPPNDAKDFAAVIHTGVTASEIKLLTNTDATKESILKELAWLADSSRSSDTTILFFSGHGGRRSNSDTRAFLCPVNAEAAHLEKTCLTSDELTRALCAIKSDRLVVFLDTCHAGGVGDLSGNMRIAAGVTQFNVGAMVEGNGRIILAASRLDTPALESSTMRNGIFTGYLLEALRGEVAQADGRVWASDVFSFVAHRMRRHHSQNVYQRAAGENFVIIAHDRRSRGPVPITRSSTVDQRGLRIAMRSVYDRSELSRLCREIGVRIEDLPGRTLENQILDLIDFCHRHGLRDRLLEFLRTDHPELFAAV
jgi:hypothetical protein